LTASVKDHTIYTYVRDNDVNFKERELETEMKAICNFRQFKTIAKQAVQLHGSWLAIDSLNSDRTPEGYISQGFQEGWDD
jgi:hypothetical protein